MADEGPKIGAEVRVLRVVAMLVLIVGLVFGGLLIASAFDEEARFFDELGRMDDVGDDKPPVARAIFGGFVMLQAIAAWAILRVLATIAEGTRLTAWHLARLRDESARAASPSQTPPPP